MASILVDLIEHIGEGIRALVLDAQLVVDRVVEHLPELLAVHVRVGIQRLRSWHNPIPSERTQPRLSHNGRPLHCRLPCVVWDRLPVEGGRLVYH